MDTIIRKGEKKDIPALLALIKELAHYEKAPEEVRVTEEELMRDGFGENKIFDFFVAEQGGKVIGIALYYTKYSTWKGKCIYLEDIVVKEEFRRMGVGKLLFDQVVKASKAKGARRMEWQVLEWNEPAISFYEKHSAVLDGEWINCKLTEDQIVSYRT